MSQPSNNNNNQKYVFLQYLKRAAISKPLPVIISVVVEKLSFCDVLVTKDNR